MTATPLKPALDAATDQLFAWARETRADMDADKDNAVGAAYTSELAANLSGQLRAQFPGMTLSRVLMAAAESVAALAEVLSEKGVACTRDEMLFIVCLAALLLDESESGQ